MASGYKISLEIKQFFDDILEYKDRKAIVTDSKHYYDVLMLKMKFKYPKCTFHLKMNINKTIKEYLIKLERKFKAQYPNKRKKEISGWMKWFWKIFKQETFKEAQKQVEELRLSLPDDPEIIKKIISQKFLPEYGSYLLFLEDAHLDKLKPTNNNIKNYFYNTILKVKNHNTGLLRV